MCSLAVLSTEKTHVRARTIPSNGLQRCGELAVFRVLQEVELLVLIQDERGRSEVVSESILSLVAPAELVLEERDAHDQVVDEP